MLNLTVRFLALTLCLLFAFVATNAQEAAPQIEQPTDEYGRWINGVHEPWLFEADRRYTNEQAAVARKLWNDMASDEASDEWSGIYLKSDGEVNATYVRWSPKHGFVKFFIYTCQPSVRGLDYGKVIVTDGHIEFVSSLKSVVENEEASPSKYVKAKWGEQHKLVLEDEVEYFFNYTSGRGEVPLVDGMHEFNFFGKVSDFEKPIAAVPTVPAAYAQYVKKPFDARIINVGKSYREYDPDNNVWLELITPVTLDLGSNAGLKRGMTLHVVQSKEHETVELLRVGRTFAHGIIVRNIRNPDVPIDEHEPNLVRNYPVIEVGWKVSTSPHK